MKPQRRQLVVHATPRDQGPGAVYRGVFLPLVVFGFFINRTLYLNPKLSVEI